MLLTAFKFSFSLYFLPSLIKLYINKKITPLSTVYIHYISYEWYLFILKFTFYLKCICQ
jgi:hypothetical protein